MALLQRTNPTPLYAQVKEILRSEIDRRLPAGAALPTEPELEKRFGVSRITIRRALDELASEGLIVRLQGRGTFVREPQISQDLASLRSWTEAMRRQGYEPQTMRCEIDHIDPSREIATMLQTPPGESVMRIWRLRGTNDEPTCIMVNYLPEGLVPDLAGEGLIDGSLYSTLLAHGLKPVRADDRVEARPATEWEAGQLGIPVSSPLLQITRLLYTASGDPLYVAVVINRADKFTYTVAVGPL